MKLNSWKIATILFLVAGISSNVVSIMSDVCNQYPTVHNPFEAFLFPVYIFFGACLLYTSDAADD